MTARVWTDAKIAEVERLAADGLSIRQVAEKVGASYYQINHLRKKLGIIFELRPVDYNDQVRKRWKSLLPELKENLRRDIEKYS